jgi:hypothetical protein
MVDESPWNGTMAFVHWFICAVSHKSSWGIRRLEENAMPVLIREVSCWSACSIALAALLLINAWSPDAVATPRPDLWQVYGGDPNSEMCAALSPNCYHPDTACVDRPMGNGQWYNILLIASCNNWEEYRDTGNQMHCENSGNPENNCEEFGLRVCSQSLECVAIEEEVGEMYGEPIFEWRCIQDDNALWVNAGNGPVSVSANCMQ